MTYEQDDRPYWGDERMKERADGGRGLPGPVRQWEILRDIPEEARGLISQHAHFTGNCVGGRPSDNLASAAREWKSGRLTQESHNEDVRHMNAAMGVTRG